MNIANVKQVTVGEITYNVGQAAAINQKKLLALVGARISFASAAAEVKTIDKEMLFGTLLALDEAVFDQVAGIVLYQAVKNGEDKVVDVADFQNAITDYFKLVVEALVVNLQDFFTFIDQVNAQAKKAK